MKPLNVLVIDDELFISEIVADMLQRKGYKVTPTTDSREGLVLFEKNEFDIVFTDYRMPGLNGVELARRMKALKPTVPICLITASRSDLRPEDSTYFAVVVSKPFVIDNLTDAIERALISPATLVHDTVRAPRYLVNWRVDYLPLQSTSFVSASLQPRQAVLLNLSEGGIAFIALEALPILGLCAFTIHPPESDNPFLVIGQIQWQQMVEGKNLAGTKWLLWESDQEKSLAVAYATTKNKDSLNR